MDERILDWLRNNEGRTFDSPRPDAFPVTIIEINEVVEKVKIEFVGGTPGLPLFFWMFDRALVFIQANRDRAVRLGARVQRPYDPDTVEGKIWEEPLLYPSPYKASPHVCDLLVLAGLATYQKTKNPKTHQIVQGIKYASIAPQNKPEGGSLPETTDEREKFIRKYKQAIIEWTGKNEDKIVSGRLGYSWKNKSPSDCVRERNEISRAIIMSRIRNGGAIDLDTLDKVIMWGFNQKYPNRDPKKALEVTKKAFGYLDGGKLKDATITLLNVPDVGISRASKILGLFDQENLCIYDSRVGKALEDLKHEDEKIILCPPGRTYPGDQGVTDEEWAANYQRLIWTLEIVRDYLNGNGHTYRLADVEMGLFMIDKTD
jgi:hypothetical protein